MSDSVFHEGELRIQTRAGVKDLIAPLGAINIRPEMPDQHRIFFAQLPFIVLGAIDTDGHPWATLCVGDPGFLSSPNASTLLIDAKPVLLDELGISLDAHAHVGLLGLELGTRRRNRVNGTLSLHSDNQYSLAVQQSFGNCPQYIQKRNLSLVLNPDSGGNQKKYHRSSTLDAAATAIVHNADTFFIASRSSEAAQGRHKGTDVSHRGGKPGFVTVDNVNGCLSFPDFSGNLFFNTLGNIELDNRVGLTFLDFANGDAVFITGRATIDWNPERASGFKGAERIIDVIPNRVLRVQQLFSINSSLPEPSPMLSGTGSWSELPQQTSAQPSAQPSAQLCEIDVTDTNALKLPDTMRNSAEVQFASSDLSVCWTSATPSLLELAENNGLSPNFGCRSGRCGMCSTRILSGQVHYTREHTASPEPDHALICCSVPTGDEPLVLDI